MKDHLFDKYWRKHGHGPRIRVDSGVQIVTVEFSRGYVRIKTSSPLGGEIYLTRSAWFKLLVRSLPITKVWRDNPAKDWDVPKRTHRYLLEEQAQLDAIRQQKRARKRLADPDEADRRERQKARHARAVRRAAKKRQAET